MPPRHAEGEPAEPFAAAVDGEGGAVGAMLDLGGIEIGLGRQAVADEAFLDLGDEGLDVP